MSQYATPQTGSNVGENSDQQDQQQDQNQQQDQPGSMFGPGPRPVAEQTVADGGQTSATTRTAGAPDNPNTSNPNVAYGNADGPYGDKAPNLSATAEGRPEMAQRTSLLGNPQGFRLRWESIQVSFVDDPRGAVEEAEKLVSSVIDELVSGFRQQRESLEQQWSGGGEASTDSMRTAFQRYRDFFDRLLQV